VTDKRQRVLLVDDSQTVLYAERTLLQDLDVDISTASDGQAAVDKAISECPDLIILDVQMPIPIIIVTTRGEAVDAQKGYACGCSAYLTKPLNGPELLATVRRLMK
jgi:CheY-like chemotaxis protein